MRPNPEMPDVFEKIMPTPGRAEEAVDAKLGLTKSVVEEDLEATLGQIE